MESLIDILTQGRDREAQASKIYGVVVGLVTNNKDPEQLGRVKLCFPWLDDGVESWWARLANTMGGPDRGYWWIPEIDDEVLVVFEHGDVRFPYVIGTLYNGKDRPPKANPTTSKFGGIEYDHGPYPVTDLNADGQNNVRFIRSRCGHLVVLDDTPGKEKVTVCETSGKNRIELMTYKNKVVITSEDGDIELIAGKKIITRCETWEHHSRQDSVLKVDRDLVSTVERDTTNKTGRNETRTAGANHSTKAGADVSVTAGGNYKCTAAKNHSTLAAKNVSVKAGGSFSGAAGKIWSQKAGIAMALTAMVSATVTAMGMLNLTAMGVATLSALKQTIVKGGVVKIN